MVSLLYGVNEQNGHLIGLQNVANQRRAKWPNLATARSPNRAAPSLMIGCALWPYKVVIGGRQMRIRETLWLQTVAGIAPGIKTLKAPAGARARPPCLPRGPRANHHLCALSHGGTVLSALSTVEVVRQNVLFAMHLLSIWLLVAPPFGKIRINATVANCFVKLVYPSPIMHNWPNSNWQ